MLEAISKCKTGETTAIGKFHGFELLVEKNFLGINYMVLRGKTEYKAELSTSPVGSMVKLESEYRPWLDFAGLPFYGRGAGWQRQLHIYEVPFYYIDYCLAQTVALQFFTAFLHDKKDAWRRYLALVGEAGGKTYPGLVAAAGLDSPFAPGTLAKLGKEVGAWIAAQDAALNAR